MNEVVVVANIKIKEEFKDEIYSELLKIYKATHSLDKGCIQYDLHKDLNGKNSFVFVETWQSQEMLDLHMKKDHFLSFVVKAENKLENLEIKILEKVKI